MLDLISKLEKESREMAGRDTPSHHPKKHHHPSPPVVHQAPPPIHRIDPEPPKHRLQSQPMPPAPLKPAHNVSVTTRNDDDLDEYSRSQAPGGNRGNTTLSGSRHEAAVDLEEDSDGVEVLKEQMVAYSQELVRELERRLTGRIAEVAERQMVTHERYKEVTDKRLGDTHFFLSEVKDELDRLGERVKVNQSEALGYHKNLATTLKKMRGD